MGLLNSLREEFFVNSSCYMSAGIEFNYGLFNIFSGPLFANLQGYAYLDLLIWGVSPILFELCRSNILKFIYLIDHYQLLSNGTPPPQNTSKTVAFRRRRFVMLVILAFFIFVSYLFMNYSENFRWNYFSRIINLDFGYLVFDFSYLEIEEEIEENRGSQMQAYTHQKGYCRYRTLNVMCSYFLIFYFASNHNPEDPTTGRIIFASISKISCLMAVIIPILYFIRHKASLTCMQIFGLPPNYVQVQTEQLEPQRTGSLGSRIQIKQQQKSIVLKDESNQGSLNKFYAKYFLICFCYIVNESYFSLWVMEGFKNEGASSNMQFNKSLLVCAIFFMGSSFIQFLGAQIYFALTMKKDEDQQSKSWIEIYIKIASKLFFLVYGLYFLYAFHQNLSWHSVSLLILPFGIHQTLTNHINEQMGILLQHHGFKLTVERLYFYMQTFVYLVLPVIMTVVGLTDGAVWLFGFLASLGLISLAFVY